MGFAAKVGVFGHLVVLLTALIPLFILPSSLIGAASPGSLVAVILLAGAFSLTFRNLHSPEPEASLYSSLSSVVFLVFLFLWAAFSRFTGQIAGFELSILSYIGIGLSVIFAAVALYFWTNSEGQNKHYEALGAVILTLLSLSVVINSLYPGGIISVFNQLSVIHKIYLGLTLLFSVLTALKS